MKTAIIYHEDFSKYDFGPNHPFRGSRYRHISRVFSYQAVASRSSAEVLEEPLTKL